MTSFRHTSRDPHVGSSDDTLDTFVAAIRSTAVPTADEALLIRVLERRASGVRIVLPYAVPTTSATWNARRVGGLAAAATLMIAAMAWWTVQRQHQAPGATSTVSPRTGIAATNPDSLATSTSPAATLGRLFAPWPQIAYAQSPGVKREPAYAPVVIPNTSRLVAARRTYVRSLASDYHTMLPGLVFEVETSRSVRKGVPVWVVVTRSPSGAAVPEPAAGDTRGYDTLWLRADNLRPIERRNHMGTAIAFMQLVTATEVHDWFDVDPVMRPRVLKRLATTPIPRARGPLPAKMSPARRDSMLHGRRSSPYDSARILINTEAAMHLLLRAIPLSTGWKGSVAVQDGAYAPLTIGAKQYLNLSVVGVDTVQTVGGRFPCWRVLLDLGKNPGIWHVSQQTGETLLAEGPWGESYARSETRLIAGGEETRPAPRLKVR